MVGKERQWEAKCVIPEVILFLVWRWYVQTCFHSLTQQRSNCTSLAASILLLLLRSKVNSLQGSSGAVIIKSTHNTKQWGLLLTSLNWLHFALTTPKQSRALPLLLASWKNMCVIIWQYRIFWTAHFIGQTLLHPANLVSTGFNGSSCVLTALTVRPVRGLSESSLLQVTVWAKFSLSFKVRISVKKMREEPSFCDVVLRKNNA